MKKREKKLSYKNQKVLGKVKKKLEQIHRQDKIPDCHEYQGAVLNLLQCMGHISQ